MSLNLPLYLPVVKCKLSVCMHEVYFNLQVMLLVCFLMRIEHTSLATFSRDMASDIPSFSTRVHYIAWRSDWLKHDAPLVVSFGARRFGENDEKLGETL